MPQFVALLRAINVGGHATVRMSDLAAAFTAAGGREVRTCLASGNVLFTATTAQAAAVQRRARAAVGELIGGDAVIVFRTAAELAALVAADPFRAVARGADVKLYVAFLAGPPPRRPRLPLVATREGIEAFAQRGLDVLLLSRPVEGHYGFPNNFFEKEFGVKATTRNWNTVGRIVALAVS